jgi:hypothetical protein
LAGFGGGQYPLDDIDPQAPMSRITIFIVCGLLAALGLAGAAFGTARVASARRQLTVLTARSADEGRAFEETLQGAHVERQLQALLDRRGVARELAAARRDRLLGLVLLAVSAVAGLGFRAFGRMADEIEEDRRHVGATAGGAGGKVDWKGP